MSQQNASSAEPTAVPVTGEPAGDVVASTRLRKFVLDLLSWPSMGAAVSCLVTFLVFAIWAPNFVTVIAMQAALTIAAEITASSHSA